MTAPKRKDKQVRVQGQKERRVTVQDIANMFGGLTQKAVKAIKEKK